MNGGETMSDTELIEILCQLEDLNKNLKLIDLKVLLLT